MPIIVLLLSVNLVEACIWTEHLRDDDAVRSLIVFKEGCYHAWKGKGAAVEGVGELGLAVLVTITQVQAVGLVGFEVGDGRDLKPALLGCRLELEVVGNRRGEAHIAAAQTEYAVLEAEFVYQRFHVGNHIVQCLV